MLMAAILWIHVLCGVGCVGSCAGFVLAATALREEPAEAQALAERAAPGINRVCVALAAAIPLTGLGNLMFAVETRHYRLPTEFVAILAVKICLMTAMAFALWGAWRAVAVKSSGRAIGSTENTVDVRKLTLSYGSIAVMGAVALGLGLWLSGT
jgi:hypothetical protein